MALNTIKALTIVKPDAVIRWRRAGFRLYWLWKSRHRCGRPTAPLEIRRLIREMSIANPLWGAPRIHGELLKLGIEIGQTSVVPVVNQVRIYWWCSSPRIGRQRMCPASSTARETGVSFSKDKCVRTSL